MRNIFKKNQIIITALAIMIVIAGYLSFTNKDKKDDKATVTAGNPAKDGYDVLAENEGMVLVQNDVTGTNPDTTTDDTATDDTLVDDEAADLADDTGITGEDDNDETLELLDEEQELGDISDDDILHTAIDVKDTSELDINDDDVPGEAVLVSTTIEPGYFISNKLEREQMRSKNRSNYLEIIESNDVAESLKQETIKKYLDITDIAERENNTEILLEARGFSDALVSINDGNVDVVINAPSLSDQQIAIIEEIVKTNTQIGVEYMHIVPVVMEE